MTITVARPQLAPRERQVLAGLAEGNTLGEVASRLRLREGTARGYLDLAKSKLFGARSTESAIATGYAVNAITQPMPLPPEQLLLTPEQRALVPFIAQGMSAAQMAAQLTRPLNAVRRDGRELLAAARAVNPPHLVTRTWQHQVLTAKQVRTWLP
ncbi:LuxR C-terminal-related transcriptional regulator [Streptomyces diacarni]|uniref:LuxR C-terminal-related transcriptional regulator n=1 Tax=Streptomyces diacarni TaxID=2800381 RepID=UPI0033F27FF2